MESKQEKLQGEKWELTCELKLATWYTRPLARCYVQYHTIAILNLKPRGLLHPMMLIVLS